MSGSLPVAPKDDGAKLVGKGCTYVGLLIALVLLLSFVARFGWDAAGRALSP